jgi:hypothetical protein
VIVTSALRTNEKANNRHLPKRLNQRCARGGSCYTEGVLVFPSPSFPYCQLHNPLPASITCHWSASPASNMPLSQLLASPQAPSQNQKMKLKRTVKGHLKFLINKQGATTNVPTPLNQSSNKSGDDESSCHHTAHLADKPKKEPYTCLRNSQLILPLIYYFKCLKLL